MANKKLASTAKKGAKIVTMTAAVAAMCSTMGLNKQDTEAAQAAFADMQGEFPHAIIIGISPFDGIVA